MRKFSIGMDLFFIALWLGDAGYCAYAYITDQPLSKIVWIGAAFGFVWAAISTAQRLVESLDEN